MKKSLCREKHRKPGMKGQKLDQGLPADNMVLLYFPPFRSRAIPSGTIFRMDPPAPAHDNGKGG
ncbi:hypothetical protein C3766_02910 [Heyndrickxia coagulans]|nr:hypothetical protein C3766_02910 [Heyndrickxia coagulans]